MAFHSLEHTVQHNPHLLSVLAGLTGRVYSSWQRHQAERALEGLSYDTLKDIGFPSAGGSTSDANVR